MSEARINDKFCFYCGDNSQITRDHVIPVSYTGGKGHYDRNDVVDCCMQCNSLLGNVPIHTVEERAEYLYSKIYHKYKKFLKIPDWTQCELDELSSELRSQIAASMKMKEYAQQRISHLMRVSMALYDESQVRHLSGMVTRDKVMQYRIISMISTTNGMKKDDAARLISEKLYCEFEFVIDVWNKKNCEDIWITWLSERRLPYDLSVNKLRKLMS
ncbi:hypothetical protein PRB79_gp54 [Klebsiella phage VLCpiS13d]|uniref:hypothetical protein n=1 Tax=Klebsiella phage VLCpiS13d TaxID=2874888 RepID=UPI00233EF93B|nr:hypothetical protein PRB79_gp54 [Klebsiella phage VLCpiS13d]UVX31734.1 hypothetical protein S13d_00071 [Klebsiella phage VLCpiS13d]